MTGKNLLLGVCHLCLIFCMLSGAAAAQRSQALSENEFAEPVSARAESPCEDKTPHLAKIRFFTEQARRFQNMEARASATVALGSLLWKCDPLYAETVFLELHDAFKSEIEKKRQSPGGARPIPPPKEIDGDGLTAAKLQYLRSQLLARIGLLNPALAEQLIGHDSQALPGLNFDMIKSLLDEGEVDMAAARLRGSIKAGAIHGAVSLLVRLRKNEPAAADALYLSHLNELVRHPLLTDREAAEAGTYVFSSGLAFDDRPGGLVITFVDRTLVPRFAVKHPAASEKAFRAYLRFVATLLNQQVEDVSGKKWRYALGRVVLQHIPQGDPHLTAAFVGPLQRLSTEVAGGITADRTYKAMTPPASRSWDDLDRQLGGIGKIPSTERREETYLMLLHSLYTEGLYEQALKVVRQMSPTETRDRLEVVVSLGVAWQRLERGQIAEARRMAEKVVAGPERSLFWLEVAQVLRGGGDGEEAAQVINQAVADARRGDGAERPLLLLKAANLVREADALSAKQWWLEAFDHIKALDKWVPPTWGAQALARGAKLTFPLSGAKGPDFASALQPLVRDEYSEAEAAVVALKSEQLRAEGFVILSKRLLDGEDREGAKKKKTEGVKLKVPKADEGAPVIAPVA